MKPELQELVSRLDKALNDRLGPMEAEVEDLRDKLRAMVDGFDPRVAVTDYQPMLDVLVAEGVEQKRRGHLSRQCSKRCQRYLIGQKRGGEMRLSRETKRTLFHVNAARSWLTFEGRELIRQHRERLANQGVLPFPKPKAVRNTRKASGEGEGEAS